MLQAMANGQSNALASLAKGSLVKKKEVLLAGVNARHIKNDQIAPGHKTDKKGVAALHKVSKQIATGIIAEIGVDMNAFPTHANLSSWAIAIFFSYYTWQQNPHGLLPAYHVVRDRNRAQKSSSCIPRGQGQGILSAKHTG